VSDINLVTITVEEIQRLTTFFAGGKDKFHEQNTTIGVSSWIYFYDKCSESFKFVHLRIVSDFL